MGSREPLAPQYVPQMVTSSADSLVVRPPIRRRAPIRRQKPQVWLPLLLKHRFGPKTSSSASSCLRLSHMNSEHCTTNPRLTPRRLPRWLPQIALYNKSTFDATTAAPMAAPTTTTSYMLGVLLQLSLVLFGTILTTWTGFMVCRPTYGGSDETPVTAHRVCDVLEHWGMRGAEIGMNSLCIYISPLHWSWRLMFHRVCDVL